MTDTAPLDQATHERHPRLCTAKNNRGEPCGRYAIRGGTVCRSHGGAAPQVRAAAQLRLAELVNPALATIAREMTMSPVSAVRLRAAQDILDRAGIGRQGGFIDGREGTFELIAAKLAVIRGEIKR